MADRSTVRLPGLVKNASVIQSSKAPDHLHGHEGLSAEQLRAESDALLQAEKARLAAACKALAAGAQQLTGLEQRIMAESEQQLLDLAVDIARKVLMQEIKAERYEIEPIVREAMSRVSARSARNLTVRLNPEDHKQCCLAAGAAAGDAVRFVPDPAVPRAECVVETAEGVVESAVEAHLADIAAAMRNRDA